MPMTELSLVNMAYFDFLDIIIENLCAPSILLLFQFLVRPNDVPQLDICAYIFLMSTDINAHSLCPYTLGFYNPFLDSLMNIPVSHNLHHALNYGHYTVWPLHQIKGIHHFDPKTKSLVDGSIEKDFALYNRVFKTDFPEGRGSF